MLIEFSVENYLSFKERQKFCFMASSDKTFRDSHTFPLATKSRLRLLRSAIIYGANASGKSNLIKAITFLRDFVSHSAVDMQAIEKISLQPFKLDPKTLKMPSRFEIMFIYEGVRYHYGIAVTEERVFEEWLVAYPKKLPQLWFERSYNNKNKTYTWNFGPSLKGERERIRRFVRQNSLFLSHAAQNNHLQLSPVYKWFHKQVRPLRSTKEAGGYTASMCSNNSTFCKTVAQFIREADTGIADIRVDKISVSKEVFDKLPQNVKSELGENYEKSEILKITTIHKTAKPDFTVEFDLGMESDGTIRLFEFTGPWIDVLNSGAIILVDELDRSLHPHLTHQLVSLFHDTSVNKKNAQLICTSHDVSFLDQKTVRRDQIWFTDKDINGNSRLYSLRDFSPRKDESLLKGYLYGRYGAVPFIRGKKLI